jgi:hypothetical protein
MKKRYSIFGVIGVFLVTTVLMSLTWFSVPTPSRAAAVGGPSAGYNGPRQYTPPTDLFIGWTGASGTERIYKDVYDVRGWSNVTVTLKGVTALGNYSSIAGSCTIYAGPTATGPWTPVYVAGTKLTYTADFSVTFPSPNNFIAIGWTRTRNAANCTVSESNNQ